MDVSHYNKPYTPQQVADYIANTNGESFADPAQLQVLIAESQARLQSAVEEHKLTMDQILQKETSPIGRVLAELTLQHCDKVIALIVSGGHSQGILI